MVIFDRIARTQNYRLLKAWHRGDHARLDGQWHARRDPVRINRIVIQPLRLQKHLVPRLVGEANDLVFDARAVARANAFDAAAIDRALAQIFANQIMDGRIGVGDPTGDLAVGNSLRHPRQRLRFDIARL